MVLPFAGIELLLLGGALYHCAVKSRQREVISIHDGQVAIQRGRWAPEETVIFPSAFTRVELLRSRYRGYPTQLLIGAWNNRVEVGRCLNNDERGRLASLLRAEMNHG